MTALQQTLRDEQWTNSHEADCEQTDWQHSPENITFPCGRWILFSHIVIALTKCETDLKMLKIRKPLVFGTTNGYPLKPPRKRSESLIRYSWLVQGYYVIGGSLESP